MKTKGTCKGCERRRIINIFGLCKRCNKEPSRFLSQAEIAKIQAEAAAAAAAAKAMEAEEAAAEAAKAAAAAAEAPAEGGEAKPEEKKDE
ncbi:MAG: hypothetical protein R6W91_03565 [Thermoplasmata archaeon]